jgi:hypothetical protein
VISSVSRLQAAFSPEVAIGDRGGGRPVDAEKSSPVRNGLSVEEQRQVEVLRATDRKVRAHELAHIAAGAGLTGAASFTYQLGPDNQRYAVAGEVSIDISSGDDPEETIAKAQQIRAAALAPADPSPQDRKVAALATKMENSARQELASQGRLARQAVTDARVGGALAAYQAQADGPRSAGFSVFA